MRKYRITVLTERLLRLEYSEFGQFEDRQTQKVVNRCFPKAEYTLQEKEEGIVLTTPYLILRYNGQPFSKNGLRIDLLNEGTTWNYGEHGENLLGTARTLDAADGAIPLEEGLLSRDGYAVLDDSLSMLINEEGWIEHHLEAHSDLYFFGYGRRYLECIKDFYKLCGPAQMLPRYALGNWWSRYHAYSQEEYLELMKRFWTEKIPFSVSVIDMDWHLVDVDRRYGSGWTGYTWNEELFPDRVGFMRTLHDMGLHVTLNVHPAQGVRGYEKPYRQMAEALGADYRNEETIEFNISDKRYVEAYFKYLHHPLEEEGVDFWWIDWQQGKETVVPGLDPLWMLNHYHFIDNGRKGIRAMIFSRYAGIGSHRYAVGFSGDSIISWKSLKFQPYFTATASNAGYCWWSHDIGGHMNGKRDDELEVRWYQFGVFSPIMRLHSSANEFTGKEPWKFGAEACDIMKFFLRLRHRMLPYLYTMNRKAADEGEPIVMPMYYHNPESNEAYSVPNQYYFGSELIVCPITDRSQDEIIAASVKTWLPEGLWYDVFTGMRYSGGRRITMYRTMSSIPVLARAGAIIPLTGESESAPAGYQDNSIRLFNDANPAILELNVYMGADGEFLLYEDDGITNGYKDGQYAVTKYSTVWNAEKSFTIYPASGELSLIPESRDYKVNIIGISGGIDDIQINGISYRQENSHNISVDNGRQMSIQLSHILPSDMVHVSFGANSTLNVNAVPEEVYKVLNRAQISYEVKEQIFNLIKSRSDIKMLLGELNSYDIAKELTEELEEVLCAE